MMLEFTLANWNLKIHLSEMNCKKTVQNKKRTFVLSCKI